MAFPGHGSHQTAGSLNPLSQHDHIILCGHFFSNMMHLILDRKWTKLIHFGVQEIKEIY